MAQKKPIKEFKPSFGELTEVGTPDIDAWWNPGPGDAFEGRVMGAMKVKNTKAKPGQDPYRDVVLVKIKGECASCVTGGGKDAEKVTLKEGQILAVGVKHKNKELLDYVEKKALVACQAIEKISIGGGQTMWQFRVWGDTKDRVPWVDRSPSASQTETAAAGGDDDIPF